MSTLVARHFRWSAYVFENHPGHFPSVLLLSNMMLIQLLASGHSPTVALRIQSIVLHHNLYIKKVLEPNKKTSERNFVPLSFLCLIRCIFYFLIQFEKVVIIKRFTKQALVNLKTSAICLLF